MKIIETTFERLPRERLEIGFEGENLRATVRIDCASVFAEYPNATPALIVKPLFADAYPVVVDRNGTCVDWLITSEILSFSGDGEIQLIFYKDQVICKSAVSKIRVSRSLTVTGEMPDPVVQWIENANRKLAEVDAQIVELEGMVDTATDAATRAEQSESNATTAATNAATSAATATAKATEATTAAGTATAKAAEAALSATQARNSAMSAAGSESVATAKAAEAAQSAQTAAQKAAQITEAAQTATEKAGDASASARAAHASEINAAESADDALSAEVGANAAKRAAEASATQAGTSEQNAGTAAQTATQKAAEAQQSATNAEASATNAATSAETASTKAGEAAASAQAASDAKTAVEETAEQLADSLEQIAQNTQDIVDHEQYAEATYAKKTDLYKKADIIHNTASGAIASFPDGAEMPVDEVTAQINPVQDLHGYENPWPAGGGANLLDLSKASFSSGAYGLSITRSGDIVTVSGTVSNTTLQNLSFAIIANYSTDELSGKGYVCQVFTVGTPTHSIGAVWGFRTESERAFAISLTNAPQGSVVNVSLKMSVSATSQTAWTPYSNICPISGFEGLTVTRTGKNLLQTPYYDGSKTEYGVTFTVNDDGSVSLSGTNNRGNTIYYGFVNRNFPKKLKKGSYSVGRTGIAGATFSIFSVSADNTQVVALAYATETSDKFFTLSEDTLYYSYLAINAGATVNTTFYPRLELGSTATTYEPYQGETYEVEFPSEAGTVYGGSLTIAEDGSGLLTVDRAMVDMGSLVWNYNTTYAFFTSNSISIRKIGVLNVWSDLFKTMGGSWSGTPVQNALWGNGSDTTLYVQIPPLDNVNDFMALVDGHQLMYELATPITYTLTAPEITTLLGKNNLWHDANGDISVGYKADTKLYIDNKIAELVARIVNS